MKKEQSGRQQVTLAKAERAGQDFKGKQKGKVR